MFSNGKAYIIAVIMAVGMLGWACGPAAAAMRIEGQVQAGGGAVARSTVILWAASAGAPARLAQAQTDADGRYVISVGQVPSGAVSLYLIATGGVPAVNKAAGNNPAIALIAVLGGKPAARAMINEMTTVASVWTNAQFLDGTAIKGHALGLRIAAGNVPNFVDLATGGWDGAIQGPLNSVQTPTMANFATLADLLAGCATQVAGDACGKLFAAATPPTGVAPTDTLTAAEAIARYPWYQPDRLFALLDQFYPVPKGKNLRTVPFMPYLNVSPSAWVLPLRFDGGGYVAGGKGMFDSQGNFWISDNFTVGWQGQDPPSFWQGHATKFAPNGRPLSPMTTGFAGGGMQGGTFGTAVDANDNAWLTSYGSKSITVFDKNGKPLSPPDGITLEGQLGLMQGIIVTPSGDVWAVGISKNQLVYFPKGDPTKGRLICEGLEKEPCRSFRGPFHLGIDQQDRIWVTSAAGDSVARFPAADPSKVETFKTGYSGSGLAIDSKGNVWVTNRLGNSPRGKAAFEKFVEIMRKTYNDEYLVRTMSTQHGGAEEGGSVSLLRPDGAEYPGSPFTGGSLPGPWAVAVDGDDNVWVSQFAGASGQIAHLCGVRTENCPPGMKTGDQISPSSGYVGGGLQLQVDIDIDPAGNIWVGNNWQDIDSCSPGAQEGLSTRCGGQGVVIFYGMAKPVRAPQIGTARAP
jgi:hypothetical protein